MSVSLRKYSRFIFLNIEFPGFFWSPGILYLGRKKFLKITDLKFHCILYLGRKKFLKITDLKFHCFKC